MVFWITAKRLERIAQGFSPITLTLSVVVVEVWRGEAPDRPVSGCGELGPLESPVPIRPVARRAAGQRFAATLIGDSRNGDVN